MGAHEVNLVLADWKRVLSARRRQLDWACRLRADEFWQLADFAINKITFPSCRVFVGAHENDADVVMCWAAVRDARVLMLHARGRLNLSQGPELAAMLHRTLLDKLREHVHDLDTSHDPVHPSLFQELTRCS